MQRKIRYYIVRFPKLTSVAPPCLPLTPGNKGWLSIIFLKCPSRAPAPSLPHEPNVEVDFHKVSFFLLPPYPTNQMLTFRLRRGKNPTCTETWSGEKWLVFRARELKDSSTSENVTVRSAGLWQGNTPSFIAIRRIYFCYELQKLDVSTKSVEDLSFIIYQSLFFCYRPLWPVEYDPYAWLHHSYTTCTYLLRGFSVSGRNSPV